MATNRNSTFVLSPGTGTRSNNRNSFIPNIKGERNWSRYNVMLCAVLFIIALAFDIVIIISLVRFVNETFTRERSGSAPIIVAYITIFILALLFQLIMAFDADRRKNVMQVVAIGIFNVLCAGISVVQIIQVERLKSCSMTFVDIARDAIPEQEKLKEFKNLAQSCFYSIVRDSADGTSLEITPGTKTLNQIADDIVDRLFLFDEIYRYQLAVAVLMFVGAILGFYFAYKSYIQHGWSVFLVQGADINKKRMLERYQLFMLFLKLNAYCFLGVMAQYFVASFYFRKDYNSATSGQTELVVTGVIVIIVTGFYTALGYFGARKTSYIIMGIFLILLMINFLGLIVILYRVFISDRDEYRPTVIWLTSFVMMQLITNLVTYAYAVLLMMDFKEGLDDIIETTIYYPPPATPEEGGSGTHRRLVID